MPASSSTKSSWLIPTTRESAVTLASTGLFHPSMLTVSFVDLPPPARRQEVFSKRDRTLHPSFVLPCVLAGDAVTPRNSGVTASTEQTNNSCKNRTESSCSWECFLSNEPKLTVFCSLTTHNSLNKK